MFMHEFTRQSNFFKSFFNGFLSDSVKIASWNILKQYYSPQVQSILLNNPLNFVDLMRGLFNNINFAFGKQLLNIQNKIVLIIN